jgi:ABC-type sugar transport system permease subunit
MLLPALLIILGLNLYPTLSGIVASFTDQSLLNPGTPAFVGIANYQRLFRDPLFGISFLHSLQLTISAVVIQVVLGLMLAHLLDQRVPGIHFFRSVAMVTWVLPIIASVVMFKFMTLPSYGFFNILLTEVGLKAWTRNWFGDQTYAFSLVLLMHIWRNVPFYAIAFMAAMQTIPTEYFEAARIDGANGWKRFWFITLPNLRPIILVMVTLHVTFTFNNFDFVYLSTGGGPINATEVLPTMIYKQAWDGYQLGYASAGGVLMLVVLVVLVFLCTKLIRGLPDES